MDCNILYHGDCLKELDKIEDESVDCVIIDPPFYILNKEDIKFKNRTDIVQQVDFDNFESYTHFIEFISQSIHKISDKMKKDSSLYCFFGTQYITDLMNICLDCNMDYKGIITWHKLNPMPKIRKNGYISSTESILFMIKGKPYFKFISQRHMHNHIEGSVCMGDERIKRIVPDSKGNYISLHPTQKPEYVIRKLLQVSTQPNDLVLDCFMGVGTTCVVASKMGRKFIGIEKDELYYLKAKGRVQEIEEKYNKKHESTLDTYF